MNAVIALTDVLRDPRVWRGSADAVVLATEPTGYAALDAVLPGHGWPKHALSEILFEADGIGELGLILPTLARLTQTERAVVLVGSPYLPYPLALAAQGINLRHLHLIDATGREALWASEQCLRSGACAAVVCWPLQANERALRRLQVAAESGHALGFVFRASSAARNPSPAPLRLQLALHASGTTLNILKCRGGRVPTQVLSLRSARRA
ncbi:translesion DNA synthesis-associated protein ImuA [Pseudolysobacter antarcticus]|uniref:Translesion DNA synthesis-associated protein ImuA n=1 Tax=Pseudolysobacter antarcticus TaxID=2511995 RepID=A0A411HJG1_9GAMM|nr:translesion DNA synthesis-associated protein ImuA [Pseudolysobacter antarcticus]QBB70679.1 translesion DNA synthesis-associated protein ImuA [Pseudolysobacter antarcticus]